jgi:hypothetical protein
MGPTLFGLQGAMKCRALCCNVANDACTRWTFTDPQPGSNAHICWLKDGVGTLLPPSEGPPAQMWSGLVGPQPTPSPPTPPAPPTPAPPTCVQTDIVNNTDTGGNSVGASPYAMNASLSGEMGAAQCRALCCGVSACQKWTYTDPQPGSTSQAALVFGQSLVLFEGCYLDLAAFSPFSSGWQGSWCCSRDAI